MDKIRISGYELGFHGKYPPASSGEATWYGGAFSKSIANRLGLKTSGQ